MNKKSYIWIGLGAFLTIALISLLVIYSGRKNSWTVTYKYNDKEPYGTHLIHQLLKDKYGDNFKNNKGSLINSLSKVKNDTSVSNYLYIGREIYLTGEEEDSLLEFVSEGNNLFISTEVVPNYSIFIEPGYTFNMSSFYDTIADFNFTHPELKTIEPYNYLFQHDFEAKRYTWHYISSIIEYSDETELEIEDEYVDDYEYEEEYTYEDDYSSDEELEIEDLAIEYVERDDNPTDTIVFSDDYTVLGTLNQKYNGFIKMQYGKGFIYYHSNPILFTNFMMLDTLGVEYSEKVFAHIPNGNLIWDESSRNYKYGQKNRANKRSPFEFILKYPPLRWAYYTTIIGIVLFFIFMSRRKQKVIPVTQPNNNSTIEFINTVGQLYFKSKDNKNIADKKISYFLDYIRGKYRISTKEFDDKFIQTLSRKSDMSENLINDIFRVIKKVNKAYKMVDSETLIDLYKQIDNFYKNSK